MVLEVPVTAFHLKRSGISLVVARTVIDQHLPMAVSG